MKNRLTFLHFLYMETDISSIASSRITNMEYDTTRIIGLTKNDRKRTLTVVYNKLINALPYETPTKKKSNFTMKKA